MMPFSPSILHALAGASSRSCYSYYNPPPFCPLSALSSPVHSNSSHLGLIAGRRQQQQQQQYLRGPPSSSGAGMGVGGGAPSAIMGGVGAPGRMSSVDLPDDNEKSISPASNSPPCPSPVSLQMGYR